MPNKVYNGTNPITDVLGDLPTEREVTMTGLSTLTRIEPLTNTQIPAGQTVLVNVIGNMAHAQLVKNIQQINALEGFEVIGVASVVVGSEEPTPTQLMLIPTGAIESVDGEYQRFVGDATDPLGHPAYYADLAPANWQAGAIEVQFKWPDLTVADEALTIWFSGGDYQATVNGFGQGVIHNTYFQCFSVADGEGILLNSFLGAQKDDESSVSTGTFGFSPAAGDIATLTFTRAALTLSVGGNTATLPHIAGMFAEVPLINVLARVDSVTMPLSIKVAPANEG